MFRRKPAPITTASTNAPSPIPTRTDAASDSESSPSASPSKKSGIKKLLGFGRKRKPATPAAAPTSAPAAPATTTDSPASAVATRDDDPDDRNDGAQSANTTTDATSPLTSAIDRSDSESERPSSAPSSSSRGFHHHSTYDPPPPLDPLDLITAPDLSPAALIRPPTKRSKAALAQCFLDHVPIAELQVVVDRKRSSVNRVDSEHHLAPIHYAAIFATVDEFCAFVEAAGSDLDVNVVDGAMKRTAMMYLTMAHRDDLVEVVLEQFPQADVDAVDAFGYTCLHYAIATDDLAVLDLIMTRTPDLALLHNGDTFLHFALRLGHIDAALTVLPLLSPHLIDAREPGMDRTALHLACEMQIADVVHALVDAGADPMKVDRTGKLPLEYLTDDEELKGYLGAKTLEKEARQVVGKKAGFAGTGDEEVKKSAVPVGDVEQAEVLDESVGGESNGATAGFQYGNLMDDVSVSTNSGSSKHKSTASSHPSNQSAASASSGDIDALLGELGLSSHHHQKDDPASEATTNPPTLSSPAAAPAAPTRPAALPPARTGMDVGRFLPALQAARETPVPPASSTDGHDHASDPAEDTSMSISDPVSENLPLPLSDNIVSESSSPGITSPSPTTLEPKSPAPIELFLAPRPGPRTIEPWSAEGRPRALTPLAPLAPLVGTSSALAAVAREPGVPAVHAPVVTAPAASAAPTALTPPQLAPVSAAAPFSAAAPVPTPSTSAPPAPAVPAVPLFTPHRTPPLPDPAPSPAISILFQASEIPQRARGMTLDGLDVAGITTMTASDETSFDLDGMLRSVEELDEDGADASVRVDSPSSQGTSALGGRKPAESLEPETGAGPVSNVDLDMGAVPVTSAQLVEPIPGATSAPAPSTSAPAASSTAAPPSSATVPPTDDAPLLPDTTSIGSLLPSDTGAPIPPLPAPITTAPDRAITTAPDPVSPTGSIIEEDFDSCSVDESREHGSDLPLPSDAADHDPPSTASSAGGSWLQRLAPRLFARSNSTTGVAATVEVPAAGADTLPVPASGVDQPVMDAAKALVEEPAAPGSPPAAGRVPALLSYVLGASVELAEPDVAEPALERAASLTHAGSEPAVERTVSPVPAVPKLAAARTTSSASVASEPAAVRAESPAPTSDIAESIASSVRSASPVSDRGSPLVRPTSAASERSAPSKRSESSVSNHGLSVEQPASPVSETEARAASQVTGRASSTVLDAKMRSESPVPGGSLRSASPDRSRSSSPARDGSTHSASPVREGSTRSASPVHDISTRSASPVSSIRSRSHASEAAPESVRSASPLSDWDEPSSAHAESPRATSPAVAAAASPLRVLVPARDATVSDRAESPAPSVASSVRAESPAQESIASSHAESPRHEQAGSSVPAESPRPGSVASSVRAESPVLSTAASPVRAPSPLLDTVARSGRAQSPIGRNARSVAPLGATPVTSTKSGSSAMERDSGSDSPSTSSALGFTHPAATAAVPQPEPTKSNANDPPSPLRGNVSPGSKRVSFSHPEITSRVTWDVLTSLSTSSMAESEGEVVEDEMDEGDTGSVVIHDGDDDEPLSGRGAPITAAIAAALSTIPSPRVAPLLVGRELKPRADLQAVPLLDAAKSQVASIAMVVPEPHDSDGDGDDPVEEESMTGDDSEYSFDFPTSDDGDEHAASPGIDYIPPPPATTPPPSPPRREHPAAELSLPPSPLSESVSPVADLLPFPRAGPVRSTSLSALVVESGESRGHSPFSLGLSPVVTATAGVSPPPGAFTSRLDVETPPVPAPVASEPAGGYLQLYASPITAGTHAALPPSIITSLSPSHVPETFPATDSADPTTPRGRDLAPTSPNLSRSPSPASLSKLRYDLEEVTARLDAERAKSKRQAEDLDRASARLRDKNAQCGELETKVERLRSDLEHQARRHAQAIADLEAQLADAGSARKRVEADRDRALAEARAETEAVREALRQANARLAADARTPAAKSPAPCVAAEEQAAATALDVALLTQKLDSASTHAGALRKQLELVQAQAAARTAEIESEAMGAKRELEHAQFQVKTLTAQVATARDQEREWRDRARSADTDAKDAREAVKAAEKVAADRADALARATAELDRVAADLAAVRQRADAGAKAQVQVQAVQQELLDAQVQMTRLRADLTTANERADGATRDYQRVTKVKAQLEDEVQDLELKIGKLTKANELLTAEIQEAHAREIRSATSPTPAAISLRSERDALVAENQELQVRLDEVEAQLVTARKDASSVRSELVLVQADLDLARADAKRAQSTADDRQKQLLDVQQQLESLKAQELHHTATVHRLDAKCAALQRTIDDRSTELESVRRDLATAQDQLRQARRDADERLRDADGVQDQVKRAEMAQAAMRASLEDQIERNQQLAAECERLESLQQSLKKTADLYHLKVEQLTADKQREEALAATRQTDHQAALESVQRALDTARSKLADRDKAIAETKEEVERLTTALETKERDFAKAQRAVKDAQAREATAHDELAASEQHLVKLQARFDQTKAALHEQEQNFATAEQASADLAREVAEAHRSLERMTAERDAAKKSAAQLQVQVRDHDLQRQSLAEEIARLKRQVKDLEGHVAQAHESAAEARRDLDLARAAAQAARASASSRSASSQSPTPAESQAAAELATTVAAEAHQRAARLAAQVETLQARLAAAETASHDAEAREVALREVAHRLRMQLTEAQDHGLVMHARALDKARALVAEAQADGLAGLQAKLAAQVRDAMDKATHAAVEEQQKQQHQQQVRAAASAASPVPAPAPVALSPVAYAPQQQPMYYAPLAATPPPVPVHGYHQHQRPPTHPHSQPQHSHQYRERDDYHERERDRTSRASQQEVTDKIAYLEEKLRLLTEPSAPRRFRDEQTARPRATRAVVPAWEPSPVVVPQPPPMARSKTTGANSTIHDTIARLKEQNEVLDARIKAIARKSDRRGGMARY
ncbi:KN motif and ankyrin repeat domain [Allomyces arbusculus]|nr:KN motif and ankyrin repeat domain [Allomyces arbusculus]